MHAHAVMPVIRLSATRSAVGNARICRMGAFCLADRVVGSRRLAGLPDRAQHDEDGNLPRVRSGVSWRGRWVSGNPLRAIYSGALVTLCLPLLDGRLYH
jgi:hypothetical protein